MITYRTLESVCDIFSGGAAALFGYIYGRYGIAESYLIVIWLLCLTLSVICVYQQRKIKQKG